MWSRYWRDVGEATNAQGMTCFWSFKLWWTCLVRKRAPSLFALTVGHSISLWCWCAMVVAVLPTGTAAVARKTSAHQDIQREERCRALLNSDFSEVQDAPTRITEANQVPADGDAPSHCEVTGYVAPNVVFLLRLPSESWNGKLIEFGCGGFCGEFALALPWCENLVREGYACILSDNGHRSTFLDALWAYNNLQAEVDHGYRAAHVTALAGKAIVARYYAQSARRSYFVGCSTGGRQGMVEAQRFPWDFNGIIAGAPTLSVAGSSLTVIWALRELTDRNRKPLLSLEQLKMVHMAALKKCDVDDGVRDGIISNPVSCEFDPVSLLCRDGEASGCLNNAQVDALRKVYAGPQTSKGATVYPGRAFPGAELNLPSTGPGAPQIEPWFDFVADAFRYTVFDLAPGPSWRPENFDFDQDYKRMGESESLSSARNPDLRAFKAAGGKLIAYVGLNDIYQADVAMDYYNMVERVMGGRGSTQDFFRLFVIPGMNHCSGGDGAFDVDYLSYLDDWVEKDRVPDKLVGFHVKTEDLTNQGSGGTNEQLARRLAFPLDQKMIEFSRPIYPYPTRAKYLGQGDPRSEANFGPVEP